MPDVVVIGAGPAGVSAAITLRRLGRRVTMVDKATFPRDKCCGDGLTAGALRRVEHLGLDPAKVASWQPVDEVMVVPVSGRKVGLPLDGEGLFAVSARRTDLDAALVDLARAAGVEILEGEGMADVERTRAGVVVETDTGRRLEAAYAIGCDGTWSPTRRRLGLTPPGYLGEWQAGRQYLANTGPEARKLWVWFEPDMIPGYAWSFPLPGDRVNFGYGLLRGHDERLRGQAIDWRARPRIAEVLGPDAEPIGPWRAWPIPARIGDADSDGLGGRVLFAGDSVGACDPMTGEGIAQALETGEAAARAAVQAGPDRPELAAARYRRVLKWGMVQDDRLARLLAKVLARPGGSDRALEIVDRSGWHRRHFGRWMFEDNPRAALATPHRWHRRMLSQKGAYAPVGPAPRSAATFAGHE